METYTRAHTHVKLYAVGGTHNVRPVSAPRLSGEGRAWGGGPSLWGSPCPSLTDVAAVTADFCSLPPARPY